MTKHVSKFLVVAGFSVLALLAIALMPLVANAQRLPESRAEIDLSFAPLVREATPAVVNIYASRVVQSRSPFADDPFFGEVFRDLSRPRVH